MIVQSLALKSFLDFSCAIDDEVRKKLFVITETHPILKNHPLIQMLEKEQLALISISRLSELQEVILSHSVALAKTTGSGDQKSCFRAIMEQNVLTNASNALNMLMIEQYRNHIDRLSRIIHPTRSSPFEDEEIDYLKELEKDADEEIAKEFRNSYDT